MYNELFVFSFLFTIIVELLILIKLEGLYSWKYILAINSITHPIAFFAVDNLFPLTSDQLMYVYDLWGFEGLERISWICVEFMVIGVEAVLLIWAMGMHRSKAIGLAFLINIISALGWPIFELAKPFLFKIYRLMI